MSLAKREDFVIKLSSVVNSELQIVHSLTCNFTLTLASECFFSHRPCWRLMESETVASCTCNNWQNSLTISVLSD